MTHLKVEEERAGSHSHEAVALKAVVTEGRQRNMSKIECFDCEEMCHMKRDCPNKKWKKPAEAVAMSVVGTTATGRYKTTGDAVVVAAAKVAKGGEHSVRRKVDWVSDSGATHLVLAGESAAEDIKPCKMKIKLGDGSKVQAKSVCKVVMETKVNDRPQKVTLPDVLIVPSVPCNVGLEAAMEKGIDPRRGLKWNPREQQEGSV
jgi:hypothetical protein